jgi:hypothetical protein
MTIPHTIVAHGRLVKHDLRIEAARGRMHRRQILTFASLACRLAGGFAAAIDDKFLRAA